MVWVLLDWKAMMTMLSWQRRRHQKSTKGKSFPFFPPLASLTSGRRRNASGVEKEVVSRMSLLSSNLKKGSLPPSLVQGMQTFACSSHGFFLLRGISRRYPPILFPGSFPRCPEKREERSLSHASSSFFFLANPCYYTFLSSTSSYSSSGSPSFFLGITRYIFFWEIGAVEGREHVLPRVASGRRKFT